MSNAKKCDRCKALYEARRGTVKVEYGVGTESGSGGNLTYRAYDADLCPVCSQGFVEFMKHKLATDERPK